MALLWIEGFEGFGTTTGGAPLPAGALARKYVDVTREFVMNIEDGRISGYCLEIDDTSAQFSTPVLTNNATMTFGTAFRSDGSDDYPIVALYDGNQKGINIRLDHATGEISLWRDNNWIAATTGLGIQVNTWYYVELQVTCDNVTGAYEVRVGENDVLSDSGLDTQAGSNAYHDRVVFLPGAACLARWDDIYVCDGSGTDNNDFLGNCKVTPLYPDGDDTDNWTTACQANHYENVNMNPSDEDANYVEEDTVNVTDLYDYDDLGGGIASVFGLQINTECRETDANSFDIKLPVDSNGTQNDGAALTIGTTDWVTKTRLVETDPDTGNLWTVNAINAAKFGIKVG